MLACGEFPETVALLRRHHVRHIVRKGLRRIVKLAKETGMIVRDVEAHLNHALFSNEEDVEAYRKTLRPAPLAKEWSRLRLAVRAQGR